jgi:HSP20 family molecular chaperone IbpA
MSQIEVNKVPDTDDRSLPIFAEFERMADRIRLEAYKLFSHRGAEHGHALDDWLTAERAVCWPQAELVEADGEYRVKIALAGFDADEISVTATPYEIMVRAQHEQQQSSDDDAELRWSEFRSEDVMRRFEMPAAVEVRKISARLRQGMLEIPAPKAQAKATAAKRKARSQAAPRSKAKGTAKSKPKSTSDIEYSTPT